jgi:hypothetical protein
MESTSLITNTITFSSQCNQGGKIELEITARQRTEPIPGPSGIYVVWDVSRGVAEVNPILRRIRYTARQQFVAIFEGRESPGTGTVWYVCEASDVQTNDRFLVGTGKTPAEAFENFCERAEVVLSENPADVTMARNYGDQELIGNMRTQALRCFKKEE